MVETSTARVLPAAIEARGLSKSYGHVRALDGVDFTLLPRETHAVVGDNGAGKSTLVKIVGGVIQPTSGELLIDGRPASFANPVDALRAGISSVHQNLALVGCRSIAENLFLGREPTRLGFLRRKHMRVRALEMLSMLAQMNVRDPDALVSDLSGGQRQAVAIARGVSLGTRVLILDEPTAALGVRESTEVLKVIEDLKADGRTVILISHNLPHVFALADRITVLRGGRLVGTVRRVDSTPNEIVRMITGAEL